MKTKVFIIIALFIMSINFCSNIFFQQNIVFSYQQQFGRITTDNIYLYSTPIDKLENRLFCIPKTYFVELTGNADDELNLFFSATYNGVSGYIKKNEVVAVANIPITPFADKCSFRVFIPNGVNLRSSPNSTSPFNILTTIPYLTTNLIFYGTISGEEKISQKGDLWYYCEYVDGQNSYYGYIYSAFCDLLTAIPKNNEIMEDFKGELFVDEAISAENVNAKEKFLNNEMKIIIIIAICLPCLFIIYLLFKPTKLIIDNGKSKNKIHRLKKSEFYEFDN